VGERFWKWLGFSVFLGSLPIVFNLLYALTIVGLDLTWGFLFGRGELLLLATGLSGAALGDLLLMRREWTKVRILGTAWCGGNVGATSFYFAVVSGRYALDAQTDTQVVVIISWVLYAMAVLTSGVVVSLAER
jgi:hypothetical protein